MSEHQPLHTLGAPTPEETERARSLQGENFPDLHLYRTGTATQQIVAQNQLIVRNRRLIMWFVNKYTWCTRIESEYHLTMEEIESVAVMGFIKALTKVQYGRFRLGTYVLNGMRWLLFEWLKDHSSRYEMRLSTGTHALLERARKLEATLHNYGMDTLTPELLAQVSGASISMARRAMDMRDTHAIHFMRFDSPLAENRESDRSEIVSEHYSKEDIEGSDGVPETEALVGRRQEYEWIMRVLADMVSSGLVSERSANVLRWRYSLGGEDLTLDEVGERLGVSKNRVHQIEERTLRELRRQLKRKTNKEV